MDEKYMSSLVKGIDLHASHLPGIVSVITEY